jgi:hypothetical protein
MAGHLLRPSAASAPKQMSVLQIAQAEHEPHGYLSPQPIGLSQVQVPWLQDIQVT